MKFYRSPLSLFSILLFLLGVKIIVAMFMGAWPTYLAFIYPFIAIVLFIIDYYFIRNNEKLSLKQKLITQTAIVLVVFLSVLGIIYFPIF